MTERRDPTSAASANIAVYDALDAEHYVDEAPHVKHESLRRKYRELTSDVLTRLSKPVTTISVLDLGAGEGSVTLDFLELGARVTAVDSSERQLSYLRSRAGDFNRRLTTKCGDAFEILYDEAAAGSRFELIVCNSFLHHIPDYPRLVTEAVSLLQPGSIFFSFQDPLRFSSLTFPVRFFTGAAYFAWRAFKPDVIGGLARRGRRALGIYRSDCPQDNAEYHVVRDGVDHERLRDMLQRDGMRVQIVRYFSTQSPLWQRLGERLGVSNTFALIAQRETR
ncbi:MAG TPA: class I SAM-dependent methyltransferase [Gemmatimonadaceae bacterium]